MIPRVNLQRSRKMQAARDRVAQRHAQCEMILRKGDIHTGLYCKEHGNWIKWVNQDDVDIMLDAGVEYQDNTKELGQDWIKLLKD